MENQQQVQSTPEVTISQPQLALASSSSLLRQAWQIYKENFGLFMQIMAISLVLSLFATIFKEALASSSIFLVIFSVISVVVGFLSSVAILYAIKNRSGGVTAGGSFSQAVRNVIPYIWITILVGLVVIGGTLMFIIPGVIFSIILSMSTLVFINEERRGMDALIRSREYIKGRWGSVAWRFFFIGIVFGIVGFVAMIPLAILVGEKITSGIYSIGSLVLTPLSLAYGYTLYRSLRDTRPQIGDRSVDNKKGLYIFSAGLGLLGLILIIWLAITGALVGPKEKASTPVQDNQSVQGTTTSPETTQISRDKQRVNDLNALRVVIELFVDSHEKPFQYCKAGKIYTSSNGTRAINGSGWIPLNLTESDSVGLLKGELPIPPQQQDNFSTNGFEYKFACNSKTNTYELSGLLEDKESISTYGGTDKGNNPNAFEVGTNLKLIP